MAIFCEVLEGILSNPAGPPNEKGGRKKKLRDKKIRSILKILLLLASLRRLESLLSSPPPLHNAVVDRGRGLAIKRINLERISLFIAEPYRPLPQVHLLQHEGHHEKNIY